MTDASLERLLRETTAAQNSAADPAASAWVSANAGTGKTHVLTSRVLRLLLAGTKPERILCLTFTKAAATEMSTRVFKRLADWASASDQALHKALHDLLGVVPQGDQLMRARQLFALAIETPGGLKVQTIHAFCERLLQRFPLEAGVPPGFTVLDEAHALALMREATDATLTVAAAPSGAPLHRALNTVVAHAADERFDQLLGTMIAKRDWLDAVRPDIAGGVTSFSEAEAHYRAALGIREGLSLADVLAAISDLLPSEVLNRAITALSSGSANDRKAAERLRPADNDDPAAAAAALADFFLTGEGEPRQSLMTRSTANEHPDLDAALSTAQERFVALDAQRRAIETLDASLALLHLAHDVRNTYAALKARRAALDYDDLIMKAALLLTGEVSGVPQWVHYKLDGGLSHILVDEAQDTSPVQWRVVAGLAEEFFSDSAGHADGPRTVFAVGDEKQSIYGFQGAAPHKLAEVGTDFAAHARAADQRWHAVPLTLSFRSTAPVLAAVDAVFADRDRTPGLSWTGGAIRHQPHRQGHAGLVEIWEPEAPAPVEEADAYKPLDERTAASPAARLAARIADQIRYWLDTGERLESEDRPIEAGDILVLVRRRGVLAPALIAALKQRDIPVSGADRMALDQQIAIQDLMAIGDVVLLPEDDLALASVLKSPLIGLDDDDLLRFAPGRKGALWSALLAAAEAGDARLTEAAAIVKQWRRSADFRPPFEFYAELLDGPAGGRAKLIARLGPEAADAIDEFMSLALRYDEAEPPSMQGFLDVLRKGRREIKRDLEHGGNQVRVMTVHGAKGLEAPIVFLPDTCSTQSGSIRGGLIEIGDAVGGAGDARPVVWPLKGAGRVAAIADARAREASEETEERNRLLYVALTRARDRLYICGYDGKNARPRGCWYELITEGLADCLVKTQDAKGLPVRRLAEPQRVPPKARRSDPRLDAAPAALPEWAIRRAPREPALAIPIAPTRLAPLDIDAEGEPHEPPPPADTRPIRAAASSGASIGGENRFLRGTLTHALLQYLPTCPLEGRSDAAEAFLEVRGRALPARVRASIVRETLAVLTDPAFAPVFGPRSRAEVAIVAEISAPNAGPPLRIAGQIDRLVEFQDEILIVDYKTNRPPPRDLTEVPRAYVHQLAAYRLAVERAFDIARVRAALLWTEGPRLMELPARALEEAKRELFTPN